MYLRQKASPLAACPQPPSRSSVASGGGLGGSCAFAAAAAWLAGFGLAAPCECDYCVVT